MTPFMIPQVFLIKSLIREKSSGGLPGSGCLIIVYGIIEGFFFFLSLSAFFVGALATEEQSETKGFSLFSLLN